MRAVRLISGLGTALGLTALLMACGGGGGGGGTATNPTPNPGGGGGATGTTITITSAGVSPKELRVTPGTRVTFVNNDTRSHDMASDPHPDHTGPTACPEVNQVGFLNPGQNRQTGNLNDVRTCGYHDHNLDTVEAFKGRIIISN
jgi:plastocyanin